jgi:myo-inositol 2-dehydrogenase/D-chiro-inositol 1-dehydrogenase
MTTTNRRHFLMAGAAAAAPAALRAAGIDTPKSGGVHIGANDVIRVGLIGCGGRGNGAIRNCIDAGKEGVKIVAVGDVFESQARNTAKIYGAEKFKANVDLGDRVFSGLDAYQKVIDSGVDLVMLATPPGFRPIHLEAAVKAGKHIFCEKPVAVDGPGIRKCMELVEEVNRKKIALVAGTQRRHQAGYLETVKRIHNGEIGDIVSARCAWNGNGIWFHPRKAGESDVAYQLRNWYHFLWVCGDHIVEQHVHNLDVINWVMGSHPVKAVGFGGRTDWNTKNRPAGSPNEVGHIWDHFSVEYEYPNGTTLSSYCAHLPNTKSDVSETVYGSKGVSRVNAYQINKKSVYGKDEVDAYVQEHIDLHRSIREGKPLNELKSVTESTATAILGRNACYSGKVVTWDDLMKSTVSTMPAGLTMDTKLEVPPVPVPGKFKF